MRKMKMRQKSSIPGEMRSLSSRRISEFVDEEEDRKYIEESLLKFEAETEIAAFSQRGISLSCRISFYCKVIHGEMTGSHEILFGIDYRIMERRITSQTYGRRG